MAVGLLGAVVRRDDRVPPAPEVQLSLGPPLPFGELPVPPKVAALPVSPPVAAESAPVEPPPPTAPAEPAPTAAGPPTTVTTARPPRNAPPPPTTTTAPGTIESRGAAALALIDYPWQRTGYSITFAGPNDNLLGLTDPSRTRITIYLRPTQTTNDVARVIAHEIGHAVDFTMTTDAERADYRRIRGLDNRPWYPNCGSCADYAFPVGDWAETFAYWLLGNGSFNSRLAGRPTAAQLAALEPIFTADPPAPPSTTTTRYNTGSTTPPGFWYNGRYYRTRPR
jgi:hypothetical protein